jgi:nicotinamide-nucleotide adenylyltransferase
LVTQVEHRAMTPFRGCLIGRFQPFHNGHYHLVEYIAEEVDEIVIGIGSADASHTVRNPFTAGERVMMVRKALDEYDITGYVVPIEDLERNSVWVSHVQSMSPEFDVAYSNNSLVVRLFTEAGIEVRQTEMFDRETLKGSEIRRQMIHGGDWENAVPDAVETVIEEIDGVGRIRQIE